MKDKYTVVVRFVLLRMDVRRRTSYTLTFILACVLLRVRNEL